VKRTSRILASLALVILFAVGLSSCGQDTTVDTTTTGTAAPVNEIDAMINDYEKLANQYVSAAKRLKSGDMGAAIPFIQMGQSLGEWPAKLQQISGKMTPQQAQRVASISAKTAPYLQK
jgi:hypothetical protein